MPYCVELVTGADLHRSDLVSARSLTHLADAVSAREWLFFRCRGRAGARVTLLLPGWPAPDAAVERTLWADAHRALDRHMQERTKRPALIESEAPTPAWIHAHVAFLPEIEATRVGERASGASASALRNTRDRSLDLLALHLDGVESVKSLAARTFAQAFRLFCGPSGAERLVAMLLKQLLRPAQWSELDAFWPRRAALQRSGQLAAILAAERAPEPARAAVAAASRSLLAAGQTAPSHAEGELRLGTELFALANQLGFSRLEAAYLAVLAA